ncbi:MAG: NAD-glutamate dehydrogenase [Pontibacterium sp.]
MPRFNHENKAQLLFQLNEEIYNRLPDSRARELDTFAALYYRSASPADLCEWHLDDLYGATVACWQFLQRRKPDETRIRVFNPDYEAHGWQSTHTVIEILQKDMPFIVDSLRMALNQRNLTIHAINSAILTLERDEQGNLIELLGKESQDPEAQRECLVSVEVDRHTDPVHLAQLEYSINAVFNDVQMVVEDFEPMMAQCDLLETEYQRCINGLDANDVSEVGEFIRWLKTHFTFLGYDEYELVSGDGQPQLKAVTGTQLGLLKYCDDRCREGLVNEGNRDAGEFVLVPEILSFSKSPAKSRVHRPAYPDYISLKRFDEQGRVMGEVRFLGLYTSNVYIQSSRLIPVVRRKVEQVMERSGLHPQGHNWKELAQILEIYPRDDLFQIAVEELVETAVDILQIHERRQIRLFVRRDHFGQFYSCLIYAPRDVYSTEFRQKAEAILCRELKCTQADFTTYFSESVLARTQFILRGDQPVSADVDIVHLEDMIREAARSWNDHLHSALVDAVGEEQGIAAFNRYSPAFPGSYKADFSPRTAVVDIGHMQALTTASPLAFSFYRALDLEANTLNFKLFSYGCSLPLSDVLPVLEKLGLRVIEEHPYKLRTASDEIWVHDFNLVYSGKALIEFDEREHVFEEAFLNIWRGNAASDEFNRLVLSARMGWREVNMLRAYAAYMKQIRFNISTRGISTALNNHVAIASKLVALFEARFHLEKYSEARQSELEAAIIADLDEVLSLNEDRVIRQYLMLIKATLRTNFYQAQNGNFKPYCSFKFSPKDISDIPLPKPLFEIFVFSPWMEGVHLRGGRVARGGLRWSDRNDDYRTEVLGLVKAQQVKNAVIVPVGAKGGFVAKRLHADMARQAWLAEGIYCYKTFIRGLLDLTDNLIEGQVVRPPDVIVHDEDDSYLVVAADKGTATFSDTANELSQEYGFWLGDAFASGGSQGYDHKVMGITAKGAWVSVERHFREMGRDTATEDFTVLGIGDMAGDVFGNGMLLSKHIRLQAAFNHQHIFLDPDPDPALSWQERQRLFELPRSGWNDYTPELISEGGGVFSRSSKAIRLSDPVREMLGLTEKRLTPAELINALLKAPVDLIWNGGIGTYVKAKSETDVQVGDKANDGLRVNACELRAAVIGEGGNLGMTQQARMEYAMRGGRLNTDFIDNAGGVDCSDHEVNIKILLNQIVAEGDLTEKQRNRLLEEMTDTVTSLVLRNNFRQVQAISVAEARSLVSMAEYRRFISHLEQEGTLNRALEFLPDDESLAERKKAGIGLTRPELSVLISYSKATLKEALIKARVADDPYLSKELGSAFPAILSEKYPEHLKAHRLHGEIVATQIANHIVNVMGVNFVDRLRASTGADDATIARAYVLARDILDLDNCWQQIEALNHKVSTDIQILMMHDLQHLARRTTRWFVRNRRAELDCAEEARLFTTQLGKVSKQLGELLCGEPKGIWDNAYNCYVDAGVPTRMAEMVAGARSLYSGLGIIEVARETHIAVESVAQAYFELGEQLGLQWFTQQLNALEVDNYWQASAREAFRDDMDWQQRALISNVLKNYHKDVDVTELVSRWVNDNQVHVGRWHNVLSELKSTEREEYAMYTVAVRELFDLAKNSEFAAAND